MIEEEEPDSDRVIREIKENYVYDPDEKTIDFRNNLRVQLAKARPIKEKSELNTRETMIQRTSWNYILKQEKIENLTASEKRGLRKLKRRVKNGEIIILQTDKSGKFCVTDIETYRRMGREHSKNDKEVSLEEIEKVL